MRLAAKRCNGGTPGHSMRAYDGLVVLASLGASLRPDSFSVSPLRRAD